MPAVGSWCASNQVLALEPQEPAVPVPILRSALPKEKEKKERKKEKKKKKKGVVMQLSYQG
jgi:hypothetical protein